MVTIISRGDNMKIIKTIIFSIFAVLIAVLSSIASYIITSSILKKEPVQNLISQRPADEVTGSVSAKEEVMSEDDLSQSESMGFKYYLVKLEGDKINVYVNYKEHEELLYGEQINISDLSTEDKEILTEGKEFKKMSELTEFTENFTS